jgi:sugar/nucleoside kinase (ribokinase family)
VADESLARSTDTIIVAGHCCLDIIPSFAPLADGTLRPGKLVDVGPALLAPGGTVSNVGLALHRLGARVRLLGKLGDDEFGRVLLDLYRAQDHGLAAGMIVAAGEPTSYSVVISPPGSDRIFLHCPGANHTFGAADVASQVLDGARLFHFGYPPLMERMYHDGGEELAAMLRTVRRQGLLTALDMALPDPASPAGHVNWRGLLQRVLPEVDLFLPSIEETLFMLARPRYEALRERYGADQIMAGVDGGLLGQVAGELLAWGTVVVTLKLGDRGMYLRTTAEAARWETAGMIDWTAWAGRELLAPCFAVAVAGTTGSGDATIAGFLTGLVRGQRPEAALVTAAAVGACSVEQVDATSGIPSWDTVQERIVGGWARRPLDMQLVGWQLDAQTGLWQGPHNMRGGAR